MVMERVLQIGPILQSIKDKLDILEKELDQTKESELDQEYCQGSVGQLGCP